MSHSSDAATSWEWPNAGPMIDLTCSVCQSRGVGTYEIPVGCMNCDLQVVGIFSRGHEAYRSQKCPDCGCTTLSSGYARKADPPSNEPVSGTWTA